jgi:hypothetical protein
LLLLLLLLQARSDVKRLAEELALAHKQISSSRSKAEQVRQQNVTACCVIGSILEAQRTPYFGVAVNVAASHEFRGNIAERGLAHCTQSRCLVWCTALDCL